MDGSTRLGICIVAGALIVTVGTIGYHEFERQRDIAEAQAILQQGADAMHQAIAQGDAQYAQERARLAAQAAYQRQQQAYEASRYVLSDDQQCVGGAVIQVVGNSYTQIGSIAQPVHCVGRRADRPLR